MFISAARRARPTLVIGDEQAAAIADICRHLDGIPLAIELAAVRCRQMPVERIASGLADRFRLLTTGSSVLEPRQQTLLASVEWSHGLLDDDERRVLRRLAVFAGPFLPEGAEAVAASIGDIDRWEIVDTIGTLVDKSLVQLDDDGSYRLLETVREFARARADEAGETARLRAAHAAFWIAHLERDRCSPTVPRIRRGVFAPPQRSSRRTRVARGRARSSIPVVGAGRANWDFGGHSDDLATFADRWVACGPPDDDLELVWAQCWPSAAAVWFRSWRNVDKAMARRAVDCLLNARDARGAMGSVRHVRDVQPVPRRRPTDDRGRAPRGRRAAPVRGERTVDRRPAARCRRDHPPEVGALVRSRAIATPVPRVRCARHHQRVAFGRGAGPTSPAGRRAVPGRPVAEHARLRSAGHVCAATRTRWRRWPRCCGRTRT